MKLLVRSILLILILIMLVFAYLILAKLRQPVIVTTAGEKPVIQSSFYICPVLEPSNDEVVAECPDCTFYPVDRIHGLPATYVPPLVDSGLPGGGKIAPIAKSALMGLFAGAQNKGLTPVVTSAYRSYDDQVLAFGGWLSGEWANSSNLFLSLVSAERYSALPGHSEHQLGTAIDVSSKGSAPFDMNDPHNKALWQFLEENAHHYGFVISYPRDMEDRTGYQYESWHIRFIGVDFASELFNAGYLQGSGACSIELLREKHVYSGP